VTESEMREWVAQSCRESGVPFTISDPEALAVLGRVFNS
jgi:hypothetical protein